MLKKLNRQQIKSHWSELKLAVMAAFPRHPRNVNVWMNTLFEMLLKDDAAYWVGLNGSGGIVMSCVTTFIADPCTGEKHLLIYSLYGYQQIPEEVWDSGPKILSEYAKDCGCTAVVAYSEAARVIKQTEKFGADVNTRYIQWRL